MKIAKRWDEVIIWQGDDLMEISRLSRVARDLAKQGGHLAHEVAEAHEAAEEHDRFVVEAEGRAIKIRVEELGIARWRALMNEHPPRPDNKSDQAMGVNEETFSAALVEASIVDPVLTEAERAEFVGNLNASVFESVFMCAFALNRAGGGSPKASLASELTRESGETSK